MGLQRFRTGHTAINGHTHTHIHTHTHTTSLSIYLSHVRAHPSPHTHVFVRAKCLSSYPSLHLYKHNHTRACTCIKTSIQIHFHLIGQAKPYKHSYIHPHINKHMQLCKQPLSVSGSSLVVLDQPKCEKRSPRNSKTDIDGGKLPGSEDLRAVYWNFLDPEWPIAGIYPFGHKNK